MRRCVEYRAQDELKKLHHRIGGRHRYCGQRVTAGAGNKRIAPVARSVSWNVTAVAGNAWRIVPPRTDSQNKATLSVAGGLAERVCDFLDTHVINYQTCRARAIGASSPQMVFCSQDAGGLRLVLESSKRATVTLTLKC